VKVSITATHKEGLVAGMRSIPGNPHDGHILYETLKQVMILTEHRPKEVFVDLGYRCAEVQVGTKVYVPHAYDATTGAVAPSSPQLDT